MVVIFPEGRLTSDGEVAEFKKGVEKILTRDPVPVLPMALKGLWGTRFSKSPERRWHFRPKVELCVGKLEESNDLSADVLRERVLAQL